MVAALPEEPGVYRFRDERGTVLYIGRAVRLRRRVRSYWGDLRDRRRLLPMVARIAEIEAVVCASDHEAAWLERNLLTARKPRANRVIGGAESEVYLRLTDQGLIVTHDRPGDFGPYLGGEQARLAVQGIHRAIPLRYAAPRTGSERAMAQARGATDPVAMRHLVVAALEGEPTAVETIAGTLAQARDEQAAALRFERAGQLQAQLDAFRWVTAAQRVTSAAPVAAEVAGWSEGVLVRFVIHEGRMDTWQRTATAAAPRHDPTPPAWREFADRNAQLAARLRRAGSAVSAPDSPGTSR